MKRARNARCWPSLFRCLAGLTWLIVVTAASSQEVKIASVAPDGSSWMRAMRAGAAEIAERTDGRLTMRFYPGGVMGDDAQILRRIRIGQLHGGAFTAGGLSDRYPALNLYGIPLLFRSIDEVDFVRARLDQALVDGLAAAGFASFGFVEGGFANLMSNQPIRTVGDLARRKVWIPEGDQISFLALQALGVSPVVLPVTDVLTALQTGLLDVVASSPVVALVLQWHTRIRYVTDLPVVYSMGILAIDSRALEDTPAADRAVLDEVMSRTVKDLDKAAREDNNNALRVMYNSGIESVTVDANDVESWRATVETIYPALRRRDDIDAQFLDRLLGVLAEYRAGNVGARSAADD